MITVVITVLLTSAACGRKSKSSNNTAIEKNSHADETVHIIEAAEADKESSAMKEQSLLYRISEAGKSESGFTEQEEEGKRDESESECTELKENEDIEDTESELGVSERQEKPVSESGVEEEYEYSDAEKQEETNRTEKYAEGSEEKEPEVPSSQKPAISDSPYGNEIYMANGVMQYGENASKAQMGKDVNTGSDVDCPYPMEVMTTRVMYNGHYGYHTYKGYYKASDKTENIDCLSDASMSPLFNIDTVMFQGVMGRYRCGFVVFTCLGIAD